MNQVTPPQTKVKSLVSIILPVYNEAAILVNSIETFYNYIISLEPKYTWEIIIVNDGSTDESGKLADEMASKYPIIKVFHHVINLNLGNALKTGFANSNGEYVISMDIDQSYSVDHIMRLLQTIETTHADIVLASPYMKGGKVTAVPFTRKIMSKWVNWLMMISSQEKYHTFTCMVRAYRGDFIRQLNLKTKDYEINPEIIYKAMILRARIIEIPAHLDWSFQNKAGEKRVSGLHINKGIRSGLMASFIFRPYRYFLGFGLFIFFIFLYIFVWLLINIHRAYATTVTTGSYFDERFSMAVANVFRERQYAFLIGGFVFIVALQFFSTGFLSLQNKRYFEELFHLNSSVKNKMNN
jgi:glycosyltransferase involved in cell wall biosynthesis